MLFDQSHPICLERGLLSHVLAGHFIENGAQALAGTYSFMRTSPEEQNNVSLTGRIYRRSRRLFFWPRFRGYCLRHADEYKPSLLHIHFGHTAASLLPMLKKTNAPVIISFYGVDASAVLRDRSWVQLYAKAFDRASMVHVLCNAVVERLVAIGCPPEKLRILNLPAGVEKYPPRQREFDGTTRFLIAARFVEKKGYAILLRAFRRVVSIRPDVHLTMMGYGPSTWISDLVRELNLSDCTTLINNGQTSDFVQIYNEILAHHDVFLTPSTTARNGDDEAGPALTMVAAQAAALPVIATPFPGSELSLIPEVTGLFCEQDDAESLASCMLKLCAQPAIWKCFGEAGSQLVWREFSLAGYADKLLCCYDEVIKGAS
jgi:glycosyltransferase involved in cell wall biosynthesis